MGKRRQRQSKGRAQRRASIADQREELRAQLVDQITEDVRGTIRARFQTRINAQAIADDITASVSDDLSRSVKEEVVNAVIASHFKRAGLSPTDIGELIADAIVRNVLGAHVPDNVIPIGEAR